jgi:hypothetical protein
MVKRHMIRIVLCLTFLILGAVEAAYSFDYKDEILGTGNSALSIWLESIDPGGAVTVNGVDMEPLTGFIFDWGDDSNTQSFFPATHTYTDTTRNYVVTVTALHVSGGRPTAQLALLFATPVLTNPPLPATLHVTIPNTNVVLNSRGIYLPPTGLSFFDETFLSATRRSTTEGILSLAAGIQSDLLNNDHILIGDRFDQVVLRDPVNNFGYSLWFTDPVALALGSGYLSNSIDWTTLLHEMGHNLTLNFPASFIYGGKIDGDANAIYSETLAQILCFATAHDLVNNKAAYGIPDDLALDIGWRSKNGAKLLKLYHDQYVSSGMPFESWNDPATPQDETFTTFMTLAYKFMEHAETEGMGYKQPLQRLMQLLATFDATARQRYDPQNDSQTGAAFRSTLMVAGISHAFQKDLRIEFRALNFPIDDQSYADLTATAESRLLTVQLSGSGGGTVMSITPSVPFECESGTCGNAFPFNTNLSLAATPSSDSLFSGWTGDCLGIENCAVTLNRNRNITAIFTKLPPVKVSGSPDSYYQSLGEAYGACPSGSTPTIKAQAQLFTENLILDKTVILNLLGGFDGSFATQNGMTTLQGNLTVAQGTLNAGNLILR